MAVTFNDIKKTKVPKNGETEKDISSVEVIEDKKGRTLRPWETYEVKEEKRDLDLLDEINNRLDYEKKMIRKKRLVKKDFIKIPPLTEEEKIEKKKKIEEKMVSLEENKKKGITSDLEKKLKKVKQNYFDTV